MLTILKISSEELNKLNYERYHYPCPVVQKGFICLCVKSSLEDEYGIDPALQLPDTTLILFPLTMISKRIETGQDVDIYELYDGLKEKVNEIKYNAQ